MWEDKLLSNTNTPVSIFLDTLALTKQRDLGSKYPLRSPAMCVPLHGYSWSSLVFWQYRLMTESNLDVYCGMIWLKNSRVRGFSGCRNTRLRLWSDKILNK